MIRTQSCPAFRWIFGIVIHRGWNAPARFYGQSFPWDSSLRPSFWFLRTRCLFRPTSWGLGGRLAQVNRYQVWLYRRKILISTSLWEIVDRLNRILGILSCSLSRHSYVFYIPRRRLWAWILVRPVPVKAPWLLFHLRLISAWLFVGMLWLGSKCWVPS